MFGLLGREPLLGRTFRDGDDGADSQLSVLDAAAGERSGVIGRPIHGRIAGPVTVIGVMPRDFVFHARSMLGPSGFTRAFEADGWLPLTRHRDPRLVDGTGQPNRTIHYLAVIARPKPAMPLVRVRSDLEAIAGRRAAGVPDTNRGWGVTVRPLHGKRAVGAIRPALLILPAASARCSSSPASTSRTCSWRARLAGDGIWRSAPRSARRVAA